MTAAKTTGVDILSGVTTCWDRKLYEATILSKDRAARSLVQFDEAFEFSLRPWWPASSSSRSGGWPSSSRTTWRSSCSGLRVLTRPRRVCWRRWRRPAPEPLSAESTRGSSHIRGRARRYGALGGFALFPVETSNRLAAGRRCDRPRRGEDVAGDPGLPRPGGEPGPHRDGEQPPLRAGQEPRDPGDSLTDLFTHWAHHGSRPSRVRAGRTLREHPARGRSRGPFQAHQRRARPPRRRWARAAGDGAAAQTLRTTDGWAATAARSSWPSSPTPARRRPAAVPPSASGHRVQQSRFHAGTRRSRSASAWGWRLALRRRSLAGCAASRGG